MPRKLTYKRKSGATFDPRSIYNEVPFNPQQLRPWCERCGWRKGGLDSWNGVACKCGHTEPPIERAFLQRLHKSPIID